MMPARRTKQPSACVLSKASQVRAASSPTAHRLLGALERLGPVSVRELSEQLGLPAASLYYHLHRLVEAQVLRATERHTPGQRKETLYALRGKEVVVRSDAHRTVAAEVARSGAGMLRLAARLYAAAVGALPKPKGRARRRNVLIQVQGRLKPAALAEVNRQLESLARYVAEHDDPKQPQFSCLTLALSPTPSKDSKQA